MLLGMTCDQLRGMVIEPIPDPLSLVISRIRAREPHSDPSNVIYGVRADFAVAGDALLPGGVFP